VLAIYSLEYVSRMELLMADALEELAESAGRRRVVSWELLGSVYQGRGGSGSGPT